MICKGCKNPKKIVNKHFQLCLKCNSIRLHGGKTKKKYNTVNRPKESRTVREIDINKGGRKSLFTKDFKSEGKRIIKSRKNKSFGMIILDEAFYEKCFNQSNHKCEECGCDLPVEFRDVDEKVITRWRYSHIVPKSIAPELRHVILNINHLCLEDHMEWENGNKREMKIFKGNAKRFPNFLG